MDTEALLTFIIGMAIIIGIFLLLRELVMWYWKINKIIENQQINNSNQKKQIWLKQKELELGGYTFTQEEKEYLNR